MAVISASGITLEPYQVVLRPLVTEKGTHISNRFNAYTFEVHLQATKTDIRNAVEALWHVRVIDVRTQNRVGKPRRAKAGEITTPAWKKAIVKLHDEDRISFF
jgi:large subunit ribosomal protein L23